MARAPARWIGGPWFDACFFFGSGLVAVLLGLIAMAVPRLVVPMAIMVLVAIDGPHLIATWTRTYGDAAMWQQQRRLLLASLGWFLPGLLAWMVFEAGGGTTPLELFVLFCSLWSVHHTIRQNYGIMALYQRFGGIDARWRIFDRWWLSAVSWAAFGLFLLVHPTNRALLGLPVAMSSVQRVVAAAVVALIALAVLGNLASLYWRRRAGHDQRAVCFALGPVVGAQLFGYFVLGRFEPLVREPTSTEHRLMVVVLIASVVHGLQYVGIVIAANRRRYPSGGRTLAAVLGYRPWLGYAALLVIASGYLAINVARGALPGVAWARDNVHIATGALVLYWGMFLHHYYLDQKIWRVSASATLQVELGVARGDA